ncbi:nucleotide-binding protein [Aliarcobacter butzleri]|uniref:nucleotide-binding protein n=1 Tax=Aliarcobacter butzleri TaxID=28197 RepID=UPI002B2487C4|nr:nucleotide-binding protein [Aliarcobacter butzleri]
MTKKDALNKIKTLISQLSEIQEYPSIDFREWESRSNRYLKSIFNDDDYYKKISKISYYPVNITFGGHISNYEYKKAFIEGKKWVTSILKSYQEEIEEWEDTNETTSEHPNRIISNKIFIVHGHDNGAKQEVARFLEKLGLEPIILHEQASSQKTIIEKIESYAGQVGFGVVLYTACDIGGKDKDNLQSRARQNVVFEHGYLIGLLGRDKVCPLVKGNIETPGDISGVVYTPMDDSGSWHLPLARELKAAGYDIDSTKLL